MKLTKLILFALFIMISLTFKKREVHIKHPIMKIKPIKKNRDIKNAPWKNYTAEQIIGGDFRR